MPPLKAPLLLMSYLNPLLAFGLAAPGAARGRRRHLRLHRAGSAVRRKRGAARRCWRRTTWRWCRW